MRIALVIMFVCAVLTNPLTGPEAQLLVMSAWDLVIINVGVWFTVGFASLLVFVLGLEYGKYAMRAEKAVQKDSVKAKSGKSNLDGMKYETI